MCLQNNLLCLHTFPSRFELVCKRKNKTIIKKLHCALAAVMCIVIGRICGCVCVWVCYHDNSKLRVSILTKLGLYVKVVTISSWLNFGRPAGRGSAAGRKFLAPPYYSQRAVFASLRALFFIFGLCLLNVRTCGSFGWTTERVCTVLEMWSVKNFVDDQCWRVNS